MGVVRSIVISWPRFGPYHVARVEAACRHFSPRGVSVVGVEVTNTDRFHYWAAPSEASRPKTLFPDRPYQELSARGIRAGMSRELDRLQPDAVAVDGWSLPQAVAARRWCRRNGRICILMSETKKDDYPRSWWKEWVKRRILHSYDAALVGGTPHREYAMELGMPAERIALGYDAVDNDYFAVRADAARAEAPVLRTRLGLPERYFLCVARFLDFKNLFVLLDAYGRYRRETREQPWSLVICGEGPLEASLKRHASELGLEGVLWAGFRQIDELPSWYGLASAFVMPSRREQWGLVVNEAMACGLPVVVSRVAGCAADLVAGKGNGFVFDPLDDRELAQCLVKVAGLPEAERVRMGQVSRETIGHWGTDRFAAGLDSAVLAAGGRIGAGGV